MSDDPQITQKEGNRNEKEVPDGSADGNGRLCSVYHQRQRRHQRQLRPSDSPASVTWTMDSDSCTLTISGSGAMRDYSTVGQPWSEHTTSIKSIVVNSVVTHIGKNAFYGCTALAYVSLPDGLTKMVGYSFARCSSLTSVTIPGTMASG